MDEKSLEMLEFPRVREILAGFTSFSASRDLALNLRPSADPELVSLLLRQSAEARRLLATSPGFSVGRAVDVREATGMAARGKMLEPLTLVDIQATLAAARLLRSSLEKLAGEFPSLWGIAEPIVALPQLEQAIARCIGATGELLDTASARLAELRRQLREKRQQLLDRLDGIIKSARGLVQEPLVTEREGRYVIPVRAELQKGLKGIVHDVSNTGATVFVEPWMTVELGNERRQLAIEEQREVERILAALSADVGANRAAISANIALIAELDLALAKARYAEMARATEPFLSSECRVWRSESPASAPDSQLSTLDRPNVLRLVAARHPLLKGKAVPLSVEIGNDFSTLIITGPNTGGKTVALKTIGLLTLMAQSGMPIPASEKSCIPIFDNVFADIGDEQSIEQTLSTFSWHIGNVVRIIQTSTRRSLVLLDELGTSTDPNEGAALARAILLHFLSQRTLVVATTHFSDLKVFAHTTPGMQNASLEFDPLTLAPTYHLTLGIPGGSNALATALRLGLSPEIIASAEGMLARDTTEIEKLLVDLTREKQRTRALHGDLEEEKVRTAELRGRLEHELQRLREREQSMLRETGDKLAQEAARLHQQIRQASSEMKKARSKESVERAQEALNAVREQIQAWQTRVRDTDGGLASVGRASCPSEVGSSVGRASCPSEVGSSVGQASCPSEVGSSVGRASCPSEVGSSVGRASCPSEVGSIVVGDEVRLIGTNLRGTVLSLRNSQIEMQAGRSKIRLSIEDVEKVKRSPESRGSSQQSVVSSQQSGAGRGTIDYRLSTKSGLPGRTTRLLELDLRGKRAGEIERELDIYLNDASLARLSEARIIHGFGTGTVRQIVREMLASHPLVTSFRPGELGEGGDGVTIVGL